MSAETARFVNGATAVLAEDPYRAVAEQERQRLLGRLYEVPDGFGPTCTRERVQAIGGQFTPRSVGALAAGRAGHR